MSRVLVLYASSYGQTRAVALAIATRLRAHGHTVELADAGCGPDRLPPPDDYDGVVLGSRVELGRHDRVLLAYVAQHRERLATMPTGFFSVSLAAAGPGRDPAGYIARFFDETGWRTSRAVAIAGALRYPAYGWLTRLIMKQIARRHDRPTDTRRTHEFTDWPQVARFADGFIAELADFATPVPGAPSPMVRHLH
jgi:menaquinone-dependent protoporphyrinogen oxidase